MAEPAAWSEASAGRRWWLTAGRIVVGAAVLAWIFWSTDLSELWAALTGADVGGLAVAVAAWGVATLAGSTRLWALLRVQGAALSFWFAFQLTYVGLFFNMALPGHNGGDLVKMAWAGRATGSMAAGVAATAVDRVIGLLCISLIALVPTVWVLGDPAYTRVAVVCLVVLAAGFGVIGLYFTPTVRRLFERGHGSARRIVRALVALDGAVAGYRREPRAVLLAVASSVAGQLAVVAALWGLGWALGLPPVNYFVVAPAIAIAGAIPVTPGGAGQTEAAFLYFMPVPESERPKVVAMGIGYRLLVILYGCAGGVVMAFARGGARPAPEAASRPAAKAAPVDTAGTAPDSAAP